MITTPATLLHLAEAVGPVQPAMWSMIQHQRGHGPSWAVHGPDGDLLCVGGIYTGDGRCEGWFFATRAARAQMLTVIRAIRLTLASSGHDRLKVKTRTVAGARIARLAGFRRTGGDGMTEDWVHERHD